MCSRIHTFLGRLLAELPYRVLSAERGAGVLASGYAGVLQIFCQTEKGKHEWERYTPLNAEFQRIARIDKMFLNEQCREREENNRMGKTRDLVKKTGYIKRACHAKMGSIKDRNGKDLTEAKEIMKSWQEYTEKLYQK